MNYSLEQTDVPTRYYDDPEPGCDVKVHFAAPDCSSIFEICRFLTEKWKVRKSLRVL